MLDELWRLEQMGYPYYIQFTLTPYDETIEANLPPKAELLRIFTQMSKQIGAVRSAWRYDPVIVDNKHGVEWHTERFTEMCESLRTHTERCVLSFVDPYKSLNNKFRALTKDEMIGIASRFSEVASKYNIALYTCAEEIDLSQYGIERGACVDQRLIEKIIGRRITAKNDANQRAACCCIENVDIGAYDTCPHGCTWSE